MRVWGSCTAASCFGGSDAAAADPTAAAAAVAADWHRAHHKPWGDKPHQGPRAAAGTACCWGELPAAAVAAVLARLPLAQRCQLATVCRAWAALVASAAAHDRPAPWDIAQRCPGVADWLASRALPCELLAVREEDQLRQLHCKATRHVGSATVWLVGSACVASLAALTCLTRLELLDPRCDADGALLKPGTPLKLPPPACLGHLGRLRVLTLSLAGPLVDLTSLPPSLQALHLNLASGERPTTDLSPPAWMHACNARVHTRAHTHSWPANPNSTSVVHVHMHMHNDRIFGQQGIEPRAGSCMRA